MQKQSVNIVGAGMAGSLLAVLLAKRGFAVSLYDRRPDPRIAVAERGRSINLALAARGIQALTHAGVMDEVRPLLIEMRGRMIHELSGDTKLLAYGWKPEEVIYSVGRSELTRLLVEAAARYPNVTLHFNQTCLGASAREGVLRFRDEQSDEYDVALTPTIATDGAGSVLRASLATDGHLKVREDLLDHDYKELTVPAVTGKSRRAAPDGRSASGARSESEGRSAPDERSLSDEWALESSAVRRRPPGAGTVRGEPALEVNALHVWPRGGFMLIALPNTDGSFTATLFLAKGEPKGAGGGSNQAGYGDPGTDAAQGRGGQPDTAANTFAALTTPEAVRAFFEREFPDALALMPDLLTEFFEHPQGLLGTVHAAPWHVGGKVLLMGDAAHAIVPFHGQGMNAAFEDCTTFDSLLDTHTRWQPLFEAFNRLRRPNAEAIAQMALENYTEMRDTVRDARFQRYKMLSVELERLLPDRFIPRYSMVMFHPEISYADALRRGTIQAEILVQLDEQRDATGAVDFELARSLVEARLSTI
ncbi:MAG: NAD(P)/FAD-dependent oxidoreductase [Gammaproteobacteria bacterium]